MMLMLMEPIMNIITKPKMTMPMVIGAVNKKNLLYKASKESTSNLKIFKEETLYKQLKIDLLHLSIS